MIITNSILHVYDKEASNHILSQKPLNLADRNTYDYIEKLANKLMNSDVRKGTLSKNDDFFTFISGEQDFTEKTQSFFKQFAEVTSTIEDLPNSDLLLIECTEEEVPYFLMIRLGHKKAIIHFAEYEEDQFVVKLVENRAILPAASQKIEEGFFVNKQTGDYGLIDKKYIIAGKRQSYLTNEFLKDTPTPSMKENINVMKRAVKEVAESFNEDTYVAVSHLQQAIYEQMEEEGGIQKEEIAAALFPENFSARTSYLEKIEAKGFQNGQTIPDVPAFEKKYSKQKFKLDNGIELIIPIDIYNNRELVEFINNPDGTISVVLKNVGEIKNKF